MQQKRRWTWEEEKEKEEEPAPTPIHHHPPSMIHIIWKQTLAPKV